MPEEPRHKLSFGEKAGYSLGDAAANFVFMTMILFQLNFYTDTLGLGAAAAGTLLLVGRLWDAFFDPMMGLMADRTKTRWGKFRPWVLWTAFPWGVAMVLAYTTPGFGSTGKILWACATNILLMTLYSANNTPYSALTGVMTGDVNERTSLSSYRFVAAMIAQAHRRRVYPAARRQVRPRQQRQRLANDHGFMGCGVRRAFCHHLPFHPRTHPAGSKTAILPPAGFLQPAQERALDRNVRLDTRPLHRFGHARRHDVLLLPILRQQWPAL